MIDDKKTNERILKLKKCLEVYFQNTCQLSALDGVEFCQQWLEVLENKLEQPTEMLRLATKANMLSDDNHALQEIKYEFKKWHKQHIS